MRPVPHPRSLLVVFAAVLPLSACLGGASHWKHRTGSQNDDPDTDSTWWPAPTPPNGGAAGMASTYVDPVAKPDAGADAKVLTSPATAENDAGAAGHTGGAAGHGGGACGCDAGPKAKPPLCRFDNQCGSRARCRDGACERECRDASTCGTGQVCADGYCQTQPGGGGKCVYDRDCSGGASCYDGACHARCANDGDCGDADRCVDGLCQPDPGPWPQCTASSECKTGQACVNAVCRTPCAGDVECCAGTSGSYCRGGVCVTAHEAAPQCRLTVDCSASDECIDGACS
jgi:hypothetical protein